MRAQNNDNFFGRLPLTGTTASAVSNNLLATHEPGEPNHGDGGGARSLWWTWTAPVTGLVNFSAYSGWDMPLGVMVSTPTFNGQATAVGFVGSPLNQYLSGTGTSYAAGSLPTGLSLNPNTG